METPKEKAIKAAYGEYWAGLSNEKQKYALENEGWIKVTPSQYQMDMFSRLKINKNTHSVRPKSLSEIRYNRGWTVVNSKEDLPKEGNLFWVMKKGYDYPLFEPMYHDDGEYWLMNYTHYQPIETPKPPIF